jgi:hypothetical protein
MSYIVESSRSEEEIRCCKSLRRFRKISRQSGYWKIFPVNSTASYLVIETIVDVPKSI